MAFFSARSCSRLSGSVFLPGSFAPVSRMKLVSFVLLQKCHEPNSGLKSNAGVASVKFKSFHSSTVCLTNQTNVIRCDTCSHSYPSDVSDIVKVVTCPECGSLQKVHPSKLPNYFQILGHEKTYKIDSQVIANKSKHLQKRFHPDLFSQKTPDQQLLSQEYSSLINKALSTLIDPISRGRYLLNLSGDSLDSSEGDLEKTMTKDPEFLEEVMELNEKLQEIVSESDWKTFRDENVRTMKNIHEELSNAFAANDLKEAQRLLARLKYYDSLQLRLKDLQSRIGVVE